MPLLSDISLGKRQAGLGPVSELGEYYPEIPFPFDELVRGLPKSTTGKTPTPPTEGEKIEGLRAVSVFGEVVEIPDDDFLKQMRAEGEQDRQETADSLIANPRDIRNQKRINDYNIRAKAREEKAAKLKRNRAQIVKFRKAQEGGKHNPHDLLEIERAIRDYALARTSGTDIIPDLNIEDLIAQLPEKMNRGEIIDKRLAKMAKESVFSQEELESASNVRIRNIGERLIVSVTGKEVPEGRIEKVLDDIFNDANFRRDVRREAESEFETTTSSGSTEDVDARELELLESHKQAALAKFAGKDLSQKILKIKEGKGLSFSFGGGSASNKRWSFVYQKTQVPETPISWEEELPTASSKMISELEEKRPTMPFERVRIQGISDATENKPIILTTNAKGDVTNGMPLQWQREKGGEWQLLYYDVGKEKIMTIPAKYASADIQSQTATKDDPGMTIERFVRANKIDESTEPSKDLSSIFGE